MVVQTGSMLVINLGDAAGMMQVSGVSDLPNPVSLPIQAGRGVRYTTETLGGNFTLRSASSSNRKPVPHGL
jgi:hypothetical protein